MKNTVRRRWRGAVEVSIRRARRTKATKQGKAGFLRLLRTVGPEEHIRRCRTLIGWQQFSQIGAIKRSHLLSEHETSGCELTRFADLDGWRSCTIPHRPRRCRPRLKFSRRRNRRAHAVPAENHDFQKRVWLR